MESLITFSEAMKRITNLAIAPLGKERVFLHNCVGRILGEDILARDFSPRFDTANMDGYAFNYADLGILQSDGLEIEAINKAGNPTPSAISQGKCAKTMTGAQMPQNADSLVIVEMVEVRGNRIFIKNGEIPQKGQWIRRRGENYAKGAVLLERGRRISAFDIGILAQNNNIFVSVYRKPRVAIFTSGDEILELGENPRDRFGASENYIYSSNNHILGALAESLGCEVRHYPSARDSVESIRGIFRDALASSDIVISTGGMSKGDFDFTKNIVKEFGNVVFEGVSMKPGKVMSYITNGTQHIFALPGNPLSCVVNFLLLGRLVIAKMFGLEPNLPLRKAKFIGESWQGDKERLEFALVDLRVNDGLYEVRLKPKRQSYMINDLNGALIIGSGKCENGDFVDIIPLKSLLDF